MQSRGAWRKPDAQELAVEAQVERLLVMVGELEVERDIARRYWMLYQTAYELRKSIQQVDQIQMRSRTRDLLGDSVVDRLFPGEWGD
jgi:hypothetical protein